jgi:hypothetical protein
MNEMKDKIKADTDANRKTDQENLKEMREKNPIWPSGKEIHS